MTELDEAQKNKIADWLAEGLKLSDIQGRIASELGLHLTYMEVRFLVDDLKLQVKDADLGEEPDKPKDVEGLDSDLDALESDEVAPAPIGMGNVSVTLDQVMRAGALVSGKVRFSDGKSAAWTLDQFGRLGLSPEQEGYKPSEPDIQAFQMQLQKILQKSGY